LGAGVALDRRNSAASWGPLVRAANIPTSMTASKTTPTTSVGNRRLISVPFGCGDQRGGARGQVGANGAFQIGHGLGEVAQRAEIVQLEIEQHPFVVEQRLKVDAIG